MNDEYAQATLQSCLDQMSRVILPDDQQDKLNAIMQSLTGVIPNVSHELKLLAPPTEPGFAEQDAVKVTHKKKNQPVKKNQSDISKHIPTEKRTGKQFPAYHDLEVKTPLEDIQHTPFDYTDANSGCTKTFCVFGGLCDMFTDVFATESYTFNGVYVSAFFAFTVMALEENPDDEVFVICPFGHPKYKEGVGWETKKQYYRRMMNNATSSVCKYKPDITRIRAFYFSLLQTGLPNSAKRSVTVGPSRISKRRVTRANVEIPPMISPVISPNIRDEVDEVFKEICDGHHIEDDDDYTDLINESSSASSSLASSSLASLSESSSLEALEADLLNDHVDSNDRGFFNFMDEPLLDAFHLSDVFAPAPVIFYS
jgi:hypothetical protein